MNEPVLLLNANYAPLNVCTTRRAVGLIMSGKASMLLDGRGMIKTVRVSFPRPSVIRLEYMVKRPRAHVPLTKREIFRRDQYTCKYCGARHVPLTIDHVIPRHRGGEYSWKNLVTACQSCNHRKGGRTLNQSGMKLNLIPFEPSATASYLFGTHISRGQNSDWIDFLRGW